MNNLSPKTKEHIIDQNWDQFTDAEHEIWSTLFHKQEKVLEGRVVPVFLEGVKDLQMASEGIPKFSDLSDILQKATNWSVVAVPGLVPDDIFFDMLANRVFPSTAFIRKPEQLDYLQEPDIFHDIFGHVPLLVHPVFADYMEAYGKAGVKACGSGHLHYLARLYWYTVEFGLIHTDAGLRTYGSGIVSSYGETKYCVEDKTPNRIQFDLKRVMNTNYIIDKYQETYFVVNSFEELFKATTQDLTNIYTELDKLDDYAASDMLDGDELVQL